MAESQINKLKRALTSGKEIKIDNSERSILITKISTRKTKLTKKEFAELARATTQIKYTERLCEENEVIMGWLELRLAEVKSARDFSDNKHLDIIARWLGDFIEIRAEEAEYTEDDYKFWKKRGKRLLKDQYEKEEKKRRKK